jgi:hypothetical protein
MLEIGMMTKQQHSWVAYNCSSDNEFKPVVIKTLIQETTTRFSVIHTHRSQRMIFHLFTF